MHNLFIIYRIITDSFTIRCELYLVSGDDCGNLIPVSKPCISLIILCGNITICIDFKLGTFQSFILIHKLFLIFIPSHQHLTGFGNREFSVCFFVCISYGDNRMCIAVFVNIRFVIVCLAVNYNFNKLFCDMKSICRIHLINTIPCRAKRLHRHNLAGFIRYKGIYGFHLVSIAVTLFNQFLAMLCYLVNLISSSRLQHLLFCLFIFFQDFQIGFKQFVIEGIGIHFSILCYRHFKIIHMDGIYITGIHLMYNICSIIQISCYGITITVSLDCRTFIIRTMIITSLILQIHLERSICLRLKQSGIHIRIILLNSNFSKNRCIRIFFCFQLYRKFICFSRSIHLDFFYHITKHISFRCSRFLQIIFHTASQIIGSAFLIFDGILSGSFSITGSIIYGCFRLTCCICIKLKFGSVKVCLSMGITIRRIPIILFNADTCFLILVCHTCLICLFVIRMNFNLHVRPAAICITIPAVIFTKCDINTFCINRVKNNIFIFSCTVLGKSITVGNGFFDGI